MQGRTACDQKLGNAKNNFSQMAREIKIMHDRPDLERAVKCERKIMQGRPRQWSTTLPLVFIRGPAKKKSMHGRTAYDQELGNAKNIFRKWPAK